MKFRVRHETAYAYSQPVYLEPHVLRVRPRSDHSQRVDHFSCVLQPAVAGQSEFYDLEGNSVMQTWYREAANIFSVATEFVVETLRDNPYDFMVTDPGVLKIPATYDGAMEKTLAPYRLHTHQQDAVTALAQEAARKSGSGTIDFLVTLCRDIHSGIHRVTRDEGPPLAATETLAQRAGACRDIAVLYVEACRRMGLAARFVSGYWYEAGGGKQHLHAWAEVYLPGGGWRGFDPSTGLATANGHIPVAACFDPAGAAPIVGYFRGNGATSTMTSRLVIAPCQT